jgi:hypothetical protein
MNAPATPDTGDQTPSPETTAAAPEAAATDTPSDTSFKPAAQPPVLADVVQPAPAAATAAADTVAAPAPAPVSAPAAAAPALAGLDELAGAVLDAAELANRGAQAAASVSADLNRATEAMQATQSSLRRQSYVVMGVVSLVTLLALMFIVVTGIRMNSRINQLDATLLAVAQRAVALNEGLGSLQTINESVGKLAGQVEVLARTTGEVGNRLDQSAKQSETLASQIPAKTAEQVAAGNQNLARQFEGLNNRMQAQSAAVQALSKEVQALKSATANVDKLNRDVQALVTLQRERYLEAMQRNTAAAAAGNTSAERERERERSLQYPRVQPPVSPNATPSTTTNNSGAIVVTPRTN